MDFTWLCDKEWAVRLQHLVEAIDQLKLWDFVDGPLEEGSPFRVQHLCHTKRPGRLLRHHLLIDNTDHGFVCDLDLLRYIRLVGFDQWKEDYFHLSVPFSEIPEPWVINLKDRVYEKWKAAYEAHSEARLTTGSHLPLPGRLPPLILQHMGSNQGEC